MSGIVILGIASAVIGGAYAFTLRKKEKKFEFIYPDAYRTECESAFASAMDRLATLKPVKRGRLQVMFKKGTDRIGNRWGVKKQNGNLTGAVTKVSGTSQLVTLYTDPQGYEEPDEILHEFGHAVLNMTSHSRNQDEQHKTMRKYGFPLC